MQYNMHQSHCFDYQIDLITFAVFDAVAFKRVNANGDLSNWWGPTVHRTMPHRLWKFTTLAFLVFEKRCSLIHTNSQGLSSYTSLSIISFHTHSHCCVSPSPMENIKHSHAQVNGLKLHVAEIGSGYHQAYSNFCY